MKSRLKELMEEKNINISQLSRETGVSNSAIRGYANNTFSRIDCDAFEKICRFFNVAVGDVLYFVDENA